MILDGIMIDISTDSDGMSGSVSMSDSPAESSTEAVDIHTGSDASAAGSSKTPVLGILCVALFAACIILTYLLIKMKNKLNQESHNMRDQSYIPHEAVSVADKPAEGDIKIAAGSGDKIGKLHNIGRRKGQQDSLGVTEFDGGTLAVVADGMGGLSDGDKVSQKIIMTMLQDSTRLKRGMTDNKLYEMIAHANNEVNHMLGVENQYKSGSTVVAVTIEEDGFQWASVGDSHIYLYRGRQLLLLNREHVFKAELLQKAVNGKFSFKEVRTNPKRSGLTSFLGMGELKYIDGSMEKIPAQPGDWLLLMTDGVFNTVSEAEICRILNESPSAGAAAERLEQEVLARQNPKQDNFTAIVLEF